MDNLTFLRSKDITPEAVLKNALSSTPDEVFVVSFKDGIATTWASGDLSLLPQASLVLQNLALKQVNGLIDEE